MKKIGAGQRKFILWQAIQSGSILSLLVYAIIRSLFFEFPMSWIAETIFFTKIFLSSVFIFAAATGGSTWLYLSVIKMKRHYKVGP
jgi:hypothetical protein